MRRRDLIWWPWLAVAQPSGYVDPRDIKHGRIIPDEGYADQPYVVITREGHWLCTITTGAGVEGQGGQHVVALISADQGRTWSQPIDLEPAAGPEASWAMPLIVPSGRIYVFYTYNRDNVRRVPEVSSPTISRRVDTLGAYAFRFSDDGGRTWSKERFEITLPEWPGDQENNFAGAQRFFWGVGKPLVDRGSVFIGFARISRWGLPGVLMRSRGFLLRSDNILTERDPRKILWRQLPADREGFRAPKGPIAEETNAVALSDGTLYVLYRTIDGYLCESYSRDRGLSWTAPAYARRRNGQPIKNPRAFSFSRRFSNGKFLLWFHNHGGEPVHSVPRWDVYLDRNPGWVLGGVEEKGRIQWSEPEILLYDDDPATRISYPDWIEDRGRIFITETQKSIARVHEVDRALLASVWGEARLTRPAHPGFSLEFRHRFGDLYPGQTLIDQPGLSLTVSDRFSLRLTMGDFACESDVGTHAGTLRTAVWQHIAVIVDAGPRIVSFVIDGVFNDGGATRQFGWSRYPGGLRLPAGPIESRLDSFRYHAYPMPINDAVRASMKK